MTTPMPLILVHRLDPDGEEYEPLGSLDDAYSVVWTERWQGYGEAQIRAPAGCPAQVGDLVSMVGRGMAAEVVGRTETERKVELRCKDALSILDRRIVYPTVRNDGSVKTFVEKMLASGGVIAGAGDEPNERTLKPLIVGDLTAISASAKIQRTYSQMGVAMLELGRAYGFDPIARLSGKRIAIGARTNSASREWMVGGGLSGFSEDRDISEAKNVAYAGGQTYDGTREIGIYDPDGASNMDRREVFVDRRDLVTHGSVGDMEGAYGEMTFDPDAEEDAWLECTDDGYGAFYDASFEASCYFGGESATLAIPSIRDVCFDLFDHLEAEFDGRYQHYIGSTIKSVPEEKGWVADLIYRPDPQTPPIHRAFNIPFYSVLPYATARVYGALLDVGKEALASMTPEEAFGAAVEGMKPYEDYNLGDAVRVIKRVGDVREMRIAEIVESWDSGGYRATPNLASI